MLPTLRLPDTLPVKAQFVMLPWFSPTMPPEFMLSPAGVTAPVTFRSVMEPPSCSTPKRPAGERLSVMETALTVWPLPRNVPPKVGTGR